MDSSWTRNGKQTEKVAWFYQPNYTKLAALLLKERSQKQNQLAFSKSSERDLSMSGDKDDGSSDSDTGSCSSGKESISDYNNGNASPTTATGTAATQTQCLTQTGHTPFYPSTANSSSSCDGESIRTARRGRSQPISRSNSSDSQTAASVTDLNIQRSEVERELEIEKEREREREREEKEKERDARTDTQMSDLEVAEELLSLVHVSTSLSYAPVKIESHASSVKIEKEKEKEKERESSSDDKHALTKISPFNTIANATATATANTSKDVDVNGPPASNAASTCNNVSVGRTTGPYRRRTNACLEHKRKHQKCPYDCIFKKGGRSTATSPSSRSQSTTSLSSSPISPTLPSDTVSKSTATFQPDVSTTSQLRSVSQAAACLYSIPQTPVKEKEFSSLVTTFFSFGTSVSLMNTFGTQIPSPSPPNPLVNQTVIHL